MIYISEGVCPIGAYRERRNTLYKAGYAESLVQKETHRLSTIGELEAVGQFLRDLVFATSSRERISIERAMNQVSLNRRISSELPPKPLLSGLFHPSRSNKRNSELEQPPPKNYQKLKRKEQSREIERKE